MDTNKMREQFEAWECDAPQGPQTDPIWLMYDPESNAYGLDKIQDRWEVWQESREVVAIDLSMLQHQHEEGPLYYRVDDVLAAIEAQGLKVAT